MDRVVTEGSGEINAHPAALLIAGPSQLEGAAPSAPAGEGGLKLLAPIPSAASTPPSHCRAVDAGRSWLMALRRRSPVHPPPVARRSVIVFVTVCTARRRPLLADPDAVSVIERAWHDARGWAVGRYVIMPDHAHLFCAPAREAITLAQWVRYWRSLVSRRWPYPDQQPIWQRDFWDTQLRHGDDYAAKWEYVRNNPVRHGLVDRAGAWPYAGEIEVLEWEDGWCPPAPRRRRRSGALQRQSGRRAAAVSGDRPPGRGASPLAAPRRRGRGD